jgi:hypothetical protein
MAPPIMTWTGLLRVEAFVADYTEDASVIQPGVYEKDREEIRPRWTTSSRSSSPRPSGTAPSGSFPAQAGPRHPAWTIPEDL